MEFNRTFECQYCYQLSEYDTCCAPNDTCNTRSTPAGRYIANCIARENVTCLRKLLGLRISCLCSLLGI